MHQPGPFGPKHAHIKIPCTGRHPPPPIVGKNDGTAPIRVNSSYRVALGCPCLDSGRNGTDDGDYSNGIRELSWIWILIVIGALLIVQFYGFITSGKMFTEFLLINMVLIFYCCCSRT
jgi:hypothetical protein